MEVNRANFLEQKYEAYKFRKLFLVIENNKGQIKWHRVISLKASRVNLFASIYCYSWAHVSLSQSKGA